MPLRAMTLLTAAVALAGCTTPYSPPVLVHGGAPFEGIAGLIARDRATQVDVLLVHGMCTHTRDDAGKAIAVLAAALDANIVAEPPKAALLAADVDGIEIETRSFKIGSGTVRFSALVWSPLTRALKAQQLGDDATGAPTDCAAPGACKPARASLNGRLKDGLLNDCLADALIYQGQDSRRIIQQRMAAAIARIIDGAQAQAGAEQLALGPIALVSDSLGSKISFDVLEAMSAPAAAAGHKAAADAAVERLAMVFMRANQLPLLGLSEQSIATAGPQAAGQRGAPTQQDALQRLLERKAAQASAAPGLQAARGFKLALVAFTDPNDLLSYRLLASRYAVPGIAVTDVLVSNDTTWFGLLERPDTAHVGYAMNPAVGRLIACGSIGSSLCR